MAGLDAAHPLLTEFSLPSRPFAAPKKIPADAIVRFSPTEKTFLADPMRRLLSSLLLAFIVVGAQHTALVHEIGHGFGQDSPKSVAMGGGKTTGADTSGTGSYCQKCFQFAHVASAIAGHVPALPGHVAAAESANTDPVAAIAADAPQSRSRGPPFVL